ncbi:MAG: ester cyclase [Anaerolineae bacterium]|nr:ester cyclase [Anaerolineae bacterium]
MLVRWTFSGTHTGSYMGYAGTGRSVSVTGMNVFRIADGKIIELWTNGDDLGELQQLGIIPALT